MLIDINLLPQKEAKNKTLLVLAIILAAILLLGVFFVFWLNRSYDSQIADLDQRIASTETVICARTTKGSDDRSHGFTSSIRKAR